MWEHQFSIFPKKRENYPICGKTLAEYLMGNLTNASSLMHNSARKVDGNLS
jgi:hypothetical protein